MVRGKPGEGESCIWKGFIPVQINEASVQARKSWILSAVAPGEGTVHQGDFNEGKRDYEIIEVIRVQGVEAISVFVSRASSQIKIAQDHPSTVDSSSDLHKLCKENLLFIT